MSESKTLTIQLSAEESDRLEAELWTLDGPLYRNAAGLGFAVRLLGERS